MTSNLSDLPSVERLLQTSQCREMVKHFGRPLTLDAIRQTLESTRKSWKPGSGPLPTKGDLIDRANQLLSDWTSSTIKPVINASGVILHTNLGRAPLSRDALDAMQFSGQGYSNLEFDLSSGKRGARTFHVERTLQKLTGAESALVVNNNAAAVLIILSVLAKGKRVIISRTQLVEIGGNFRVPEVMKQSGAKLVEIGATNKVHLRDYKTELETGAALVLRAHRSNFKIIGFTEEPSIAEISRLSHEFGVPFIDDLGSGALLNTEKFGLGHEPTIQESLAAGADLVCFSGDKLLGGPQAGIIIGRSELLEKIKKHPMVRALRADKFCLAALNATLLHYLKDEAIKKIPVWKMISLSPEKIKTRARAWNASLGHGEVVRSESTIGGGSLPEERLPTYVLALHLNKPDKFLTKLRAGNPPLVARVEDDAILFDPRTVLEEQDPQLVAILKSNLMELP
jgi:L-seryl-tRNA(Ser) seleniumtransferase